MIEKLIDALVNEPLLGLAVLTGSKMGAKAVMYAPVLAGLIFIILCLNSHNLV